MIFRHIVSVIIAFAFFVEPIVSCACGCNTGCSSSNIQNPYFDPPKPVQLPTCCKPPPVYCQAAPTPRCLQPPQKSYCSELPVVGVLQKFSAYKFIPQPPCHQHPKLSCQPYGRVCGY